MTDNRKPNLTNQIAYNVGRAEDIVRFTDGEGNDWLLLPENIEWGVVSVSTQGTLESLESVHEENADLKLQVETLQKSIENLHKDGKTYTKTYLRDLPIKELRALGVSEGVQSKIKRDIIYELTKGK